jgi:DNA-binding beta-propeller fold protein YncE
MLRRASYNDRAVERIAQLGAQRRRLPWPLYVGAAILACVLFGAGIAIADVPDGNTINGCRNTSTFAIRVIDKSAGQSCTASETALSWTNWKWRGAYSASTQYNVGDVVFFRSSSYLVIVKPATPKVPPTNTTDWSLIDQGTNWKGAWSSATAYLPGDAVSYSGTSYLATLASTNKVPSSNPTIWAVLAAQGATGPQGSGTPQLSKSQIALRKWWQDPARSTTYAVGNGPFIPAFDGANIWLPNENAGTISKINIATGTVTTPVTGLSAPTHVLFDGTNLWVCDDGTNTVLEISTTGTVLHTITGFIGPYGLAFDGTKIWVANIRTDTVSRINPAGTPAIDATATVSFGPADLTFDGSHIWVISGYSNTVTEIDPTTGAIVGSPIAVSGGSTSGAYITYDGTSIWADSSSWVSKINPTTQTVTATVTFGTTFGAGELAFDGTHLWVPDRTNGKIAKIDPSTDSVIATGGDGLSAPIGTVFDGTDVWVTNNFGGTVTKFRAP